SELSLSLSHLPPQPGWRNWQTQRTLLVINARIVANPELIRKQAPGNRSDGFRSCLTRSASSSVACGFALEWLRDAKRVYEKTKSGRARDARQELHNAERAAATQR